MRLALCQSVIVVLYYVISVINNALRGVFSAKEDPRNDEKLEEINWEPDRMSESQINRFLLVSRYLLYLKTTC